VFLPTLSLDRRFTVKLVFIVMASGAGYWLLSDPKLPHFRGTKPVPASEHTLYNGRVLGASAALHQAARVARHGKGTWQTSHRSCVRRRHGRSYNDMKMSHTESSSSSQFHTAAAVSASASAALPPPPVTAALSSVSAASTSTSATAPAPAPAPAPVPVPAPATASASTTVHEWKLSTPVNALDNSKKVYRLACSRCNVTLGVPVLQVIVGKSMIIDCYHCGHRMARLPKR
jgi:hypothetical protein